MSRTLRSKRLLPGLALGLLVLALAACGGRVETRGNLPDPDRLSEIRLGEHSRDQVARVLGTPSSIAVFGEEVWYYISERTTTVAFFEPEINERKIVILRFDKKGVVSDIQTLGMEQAHAIQPVERRTPTLGKDVGLMEQLLGNFGRFDN